MWIKNPTDATVCRYLFTAKLLYMFRVSQHTSSGVSKTVPAASGTGHTTCTATPLLRGLVWTGCTSRVILQLLSQKQLLILRNENLCFRYCQSICLSSTSIFVSFPQLNNLVEKILSSLGNSLWYSVFHATWDSLRFWQPPNLCHINTIALWSSFINNRV